MKSCFESILTLSAAISEEDIDDPPHPDGKNKYGEEFEDDEEFIGIEGYTVDG